MTSPATSEPAADAFVGRQQELPAVLELLERGCRLVTLVGPPGIGKSRLARRVLDRRPASEPPAIWVPLADAGDATALASAIAWALGARPSAELGGADPLVLAAHAIAARGPVLVVLDEFERLVRYGLVTIQRWHDLAPAAQILVTSRERLRLPDEVVFEIGPLSLPERDETFEGDAVALLLDRVRRRRGAYEPPSDERVALGRIARVLDGIPLALELAAARLDVLDAGALLVRLSERFELLRDASADGLERSLDRAVACSWELLAPEEQRALGACTVFRGGFDAEAAEAVLAEEGHRTALDRLQSLRDKSLVAALDSGAGRRLTLYATLRDWVERRCPPEQTAQDRSRHLRYYARLADRLAEAASPARERLTLEQENLLAALPVGLADDARDDALSAGLSIAAALEVLAGLRVPLEPHLAWLDRAVAAAERLGDRRLAGLRTSRAVALRRAGRYDEAAAELERAIADGPDDRTAGRAWSGLGRVEILRGRLDEADRALARALELHRAVDDRRAEASTVSAIGYVALQRGSVDGALARAAEALGRARGQDPRVEAECLYYLALVHHHAGSLAAARQAYDEALSAAQAAGDTFLGAWCRIETGLVLLEEGRLAEARSTLQAVEPSIAGFDPRGEGLLLTHLGAVLALQGEVTEAGWLLDRAEQLLQASDVFLVVAVAGPQRGLLDLAHATLARHAHDPERATMLERRALERLERARAGAGPLDPDCSQGASVLNTDLVVATRILAAALRDRGLLAAPEEGAGDGLVVDREGRWFEPPGKARVSCARRHTLRRILVALVAARLDRPGVALAREELQRAGWPGEKLRGASASNRLHVALHELRKLGLAGHVLSSEQGWQIDPTLPVRWGS